MEEFKLSKKQIQAIETKKKIFETSIRMFKENGYHKTTIRQITKEAGVALGSFFTYFNSKESIIAVCIKDMEDGLKEYMPTIKNKSAREKMLCYIEYVLDWYENKFGLEFFAVTLSYYSQRTKKVHSDFDVHSDRWTYRDYLKDFIIEGQKNGEFRKDIDEDKLYMLLEMFIHGVLLNWCLYLDTYSLSEKGKEYFDLIINDVLINKE